MGIPQGQYCDIGNDLKIHYHEAGSGPAVLFIHGSGPGASGYSNFKFNFQEFAKAGYRAIVPDLIGYGYSSQPQGAEYHLDFFLDCLVQFVEALDIGECTLVGNSLGGAIAIGLALRYPGRIRKLILMAPGGIENIDEYRKMPGIQAMMSGFLSDEGLDRQGLKELLGMQLFQAEMKTELVAQSVDERFEVMRAQPKAVLATLKVPDHTPNLSRISCPILGFWGMNDLFCPVSGAMKMLSHCQNTRFILMTECGHWVMIEHHELFNRECLEFLSE